VWPSAIGRIIRDEFNQEDLEPFYEKASVELGQVKSLSKHPLIIASWLAGAWGAGMRSPTLQRLCESILAHCAPPRTTDALGESEAALPVTSLLSVLIAVAAPDGN
jgi:hypothetical protein